MSYWTFDLIALGLPVLLLVRGRPVPSRLLVRATGALSLVALAWTIPWDGHLVREGVWSHGPDRVLAVVWDVPVEELAFVVLLVALVSAWGHRTGLLPGRAACPEGGRRGVVGWLVTALVGAALVAVGGRLTYLGLLLAWAAVPLALQHAVAGDLLRPLRRTRAVIALPVAAWLCVADRLALADGIWQINPATSTGLLLAGLPLEEVLFFLLTTVLVTDGLLLATDQRALHRTRALVARSGPSRRLVEGTVAPASRHRRRT